MQSCRGTSLPQWLPGTSRRGIILGYLEPCERRLGHRFLFDGAFFPLAVQQLFPRLTCALSLVSSNKFIGKRSFGLWLEYRNWVSGHKSRKLVLGHHFSPLEHDLVCIYHYP